MMSVVAGVSYPTLAFGIFAGYLYTDDNVRSILSSGAELLLTGEAGVNVSGIAAVLRSTSAMEADAFKGAARKEFTSEAIVTAALAATGVNVTAGDTGLTLAVFQVLATQCVFNATDENVTSFVEAAAGSHDTVALMVSASQVRFLLRTE